MRKRNENEDILERFATRTPGPNVTTLLLSALEKKARRCFALIALPFGEPLLLLLGLWLSVELKEVLSLSSDEEERKIRRRETSSPMLCVSGNGGGVERSGV